MFLGELGTLPRVAFSVPMLRYVGFANNSLSGMVELIDIAKITKLLSGPFPDLTDYDGDMAFVDISGNSIAGTLPL